MYRFIGGQDAYGLFNTFSIVVTLLSSLFLFSLKRNVLGLHSKRIVYFVSHANNTAGNIVKYILISVESLIMAGVLVYSTSYNMAFGELVGTGGNYFATLFLVLPLWFVVSLILMTNPLKQIDIYTLLAPIFLFFVKIACFCNGCCWGIPWEYGLYNHHYDHPGKQVPVQAIEAFWALAILIFLLWYRKRAKTGTMFPMYMILYSATRFCSEFFRREENVLGPLKVYHLLCIAGFVIGLVLFFIVKRYGDKISSFFEKPHAKIDMQIAELESLHQTEWYKSTKERTKKEKRQNKERERKNKKLYSHSRKL